MTRTVSSADPRDRKALALLAQAPTWTFGTRKVDGVPFAIVPASTPGATYFTSAIGCTCPDHRARGGECKHMRAYCLYRLQTGQDVRPAAPAPTGAGSDEPVILTADEEAALDLAFAALSPLAGPIVETVRPTDRYSVLFPVEA